MIDLRLKYGTNNIPILSNETIDEHAERLIGDYDSSLLSRPQAIDVEDFAENYLGLHFHFTDLSHNGFIVSAKYSCGFPDPQVLPIIVVDRYLDYFTTITEDRLWQVLAKPAFQWRNRSGLSMNADRAA